MIGKRDYFMTPNGRGDARLDRSQRRKGRQAGPSRNSVELIVGKAILVRLQRGGNATRGLKSSAYRIGGSTAFRSPGRHHARRYDRGKQQESSGVTGRSEGTVAQVRLSMAEHEGGTGVQAGLAMVDLGAGTGM